MGDGRAEGTVPPARRCRVGSPRSRPTQMLAILGIMILLAIPLGLRAQQYNLDWFTLDGGGGTSAGGNYTLSGAIGQPDAGAMSGGNFTLEGGFWPGLTVPIPEVPTTLLIQLVSGGVRISWTPATPGFVLEMTDDLAGSLWTPALAGNPVTIPMGGTSMFFQLRRP